MYNVIELKRLGHVKAKLETFRDWGVEHVAFYPAESYADKTDDQVADLLRSEDVAMRNGAVMVLEERRRLAKLKHPGFVSGESNTKTVHHQSIGNYGWTGVETDREGFVAFHDDKLYERATDEELVHWHSTSKHVEVRNAAYFELCDRERDFLCVE